MYTHALRYEEFNGTVYNTVQYRVATRSTRLKIPDVNLVKNTFSLICYINPNISGQKILGYLWALVFDLGGCVKVSTILGVRNLWRRHFTFINFLTVAPHSDCSTHNFPCS